jgi:C-terminal processing protease CtpA/Prc
VARPGEEKPIALAAKLRGPRVSIGISWRGDSAENGVATIVRVVPGSPAARADLRVADRIYSAAGEALVRHEQLREILGRPAKSIELLVERRGQLRTVTIEGISRSH